MYNYVIWKNCYSFAFHCIVFHILVYMNKQSCIRASSWLHDKIRSTGPKFKSPDTTVSDDKPSTTNPSLNTVMLPSVRGKSAKNSSIFLIRSHMPYILGLLIWWFSILKSSSWEFNRICFPSGQEWHSYEPSQMWCQGVGSPSPFCCFWYDLSPYFNGIQIGLGLSVRLLIGSAPTWVIDLKGLKLAIFRLWRSPRLSDGPPVYHNIIYYTT